MTLSRAALLLVFFGGVEPVGSEETKRIGCAPATNEIKQKFLFEREYINYAWAPVHNGWYVDFDGNVYCYAYKRGDLRWSPRQWNAPTETELVEKYNHSRKFAFRMDAATLNRNYGLIEAASRGSYSPPVERGRDAGGTELIAYLFDPGTGVYQRIQLAVRGNKNVDNLSASAETLSRWLDSLASRVDLACDQYHWGVVVKYKRN